MRILLAEDEKALSKVLMKILEKNNYSVEAVYNGEDALYWLKNVEYDAAILDIMMPKLDGISVLKGARAAGKTLPVLMLTAKSEVEDKVLGLDSGANDYLTKPFDSRELLARLRAITRGKAETDMKLCFGNIALDKATFEMSTQTGSVKLPNKEYQMMEFMLSNPRSVISTERFLEKVWGLDTDAGISVVWVYISNLRKKLAAVHANVQIKASRNAGYSLEDTDA